MIPKLLSIRQAAELTGKSRYQIWYALIRGHISSEHCQKVDGWWVLTEDFEIRKAGVNSDPFLAGLPSEFTRLDLELDFDAITSKQVQGNSAPQGHSRIVSLPGFERETEGLSVSEVYRLTNVHPSTQKRIRDGKAVRAGVALRLARGLSIEIERLLK